MKTIIITNGDIGDFNYYNDIIKEQEYIICVDGAMRHIVKMDIRPDVVIGDLDSISDEYLQIIKDKEIPISKFPSEKDETDTELAVMLALEKQSSEIILIGGVGSRIDHSFINITLLANTAKKGIKCRLIHEKNDCYFVDSKISFVDFDRRCNLSIIPITDEIIVGKTEGLYYPLENEVICMGSSRGISNVAIDNKVEITIKKGVAMIILARD